MEAVIKSGERVSIEIGYTVEYLSPTGVVRIAEVIGFNEINVLVTWDGHPGSTELGSYGEKYRAKYQVDPKWPDDTTFFRVSYRWLDVVRQMNIVTPELRTQLSAAAWGEATYKAPPGAPFEFL